MGLVFGVGIYIVGIEWFPSLSTVIKGFTHSLVHVKRLRDSLDHRIQATLEVGWHWKYGYFDLNEPHDSRGCWGFWRGHSGAEEEAWPDWPIIVV